MVIRIENKDDLSEKLENNDCCVVKFSANAWCAPCKAMVPVVEEVASKNSSVLFCDVDIDTHPEIASSFNVKSIPCLIFFKKGQEIDRHAGAIPATKLIELIEVNAK